MSTTMTGVDARGYLIGWSKALASMYSADINAVPEEKWGMTHGGCSRSAQELTSDAVAMLNWTTEALKGNVSETYDESTMQELAGKMATREEAVAKLNEAVDNFGAALGAASDDDLNKMVTPPWKMDAPLYMLAQIAVSHLWYHDGQLNYIQCLLGDDKVHWMG